MADNPALEIEEATPVKRKGVKRRTFLIGGFALAGAGAFGVYWADRAASKLAARLVVGNKEAGFATWIKIAEDDTVTMYSPHTDIGQGSNTGMAQLLAEELDTDWAKVKVVSAPAEAPFANTGLGRGFLGNEMLGQPGLVDGMPASLISFIARSLNLQTTGGSSAVRYTGTRTMQLVGAATRKALVETAAARLNVPVSELTTADSKVIHAKSGKSLRYGELAVEASSRSLDSAPKLKVTKDYKLVGKPIPRLDIPGKVNGTAQYGMDYSMPDMRVATVMAAPARGGKLESVDPAPAMAVKGVEKVIKLDDAVVVVAKGYWAALNGLRSLSPKFSDGGNGGISTASIFADQAKMFPAKAAAAAGAVEARYEVPFLHHAMMEPFALTAHFKNGRLDLWGGQQDPLAAKMQAVKTSGLSDDAVTFHPMLIGGSFGRRLPMYMEIVDQVTKVAMQLPYPVKIIWSREEEVAQGAYRPQSSSRLFATLGADGKVGKFQNDYAQPESAEAETTFIYDLPDAVRNHHEQTSNQIAGAWRSVNSTQQGFYNESFMDELALAAKTDPVEFRRKHLTPGSRHLAVLDEVAKRSGWGSPLPAGVGRGVAIVQSFRSIVAQVVEASVREDGTPKVQKVWCVVDCGTTVNPQAAAAQIEGGIVMGLSSAIGEAITLDKGVVQQSNFSDYPVLKLAETPVIDVHFIESGADMGGIGEPGVPPAAPALANALFAATGKRVRQLPIKDQAKA